MSESPSTKRRGKRRIVMGARKVGKKKKERLVGWFKAANFVGRSTTMVWSTWEEVEVGQWPIR